ncbi:MAG: DNA translocase FtsK 4TM domain-containing protein [Betaproteobacteria bacterium]|nr:DNA translocase FtsK 4TM domain-containing protein [Betaproteobacteria bacterium]
MCRYRLVGLSSAGRPALGRPAPLAIALIGFVVVLVSSSAIEFLRFHSMKMVLPLEAGGMLGHEIGTRPYAISVLRATLLLLALLAVGWSLFSGMSWLNAAERVGAMLEGSYLGIRDLYERWQDRRIGREVAQQREVEVEVELSGVEQHEPIFIEMPAPVVEVSKKVRSASSASARRRCSPKWSRAACCRRCTCWHRLPHRLICPVPRR